MSHSDFVHLHLHSQYSLLDGAIRFEELLKKAKGFRMPAVALTDHGNIFGAIEFYTKAESHGLKPIIGCEIYLAPGSRFEKDPSSGENAYHLILLAEDIRGYKNLCKIITTAYLEGFYYKPRIDKEFLEAHSEGLIAMSACLHGEIPHSILAGDMDRALSLAGWYREVFGDRFYLEVMDNGIPEQGKVNEGIFEIGKRLDIPVVATNDCHYLNREDARAHDVLLCIQTGKNVDTPGRLRFKTDQFYLKSPEEMFASFKDHRDVLLRTIEIAERCNLVFRFGEHHFPIFPVPQGESLDTYLEKMARTGLEERLSGAGEEKRRLYYRRLEKELEIIKKMGYSGYFLIVADFISYAKSRNIPVGPGRGSAAGSLVAYALKITDIDPIEHGLIFERFLNPERVSLPDIDIDFCMERRDEVIAYVAEKYGRENVAQIITFGKMQARAVIRDVGRALNLPYNEVDRIAKLIPSLPNITIDGALKEEPRLSKAYNEDRRVRELIDIARSLEGLTRHASTHAAGVVISNRPLVEYMPLYRGQKDDTITTHYAMNDVERLGLLKFDFLGLKTLTVIDRTLKLIKERQGRELYINTIPQDDPATFKLLSSGATNGIFQLEGSGVREILKKLKPETFEDLIAVVALYRPGPLGSGMVDEFIERKHGRKEITYEVPQLEGILKNTYGVIVYQEQVMEIATKLAGFTPGEADILRRAMGKKKPEEMVEQRDRFLKGARKNGIPLKKAERIFDLMAKFAGYGFNKSHSAAYALIAYQTAYLKAHYPLEFMTALLTHDINNENKVIKYIGECKEMGIEVLPPNVNESFRDFTIVKDSIRFGLAAVKNVGDSAIESIIEAREKEGPFTSLLDFCSKVDLRKVNKRVIESLIKSGAFDFTGLKRSQLMAILDRAMEMGGSRQKDRNKGQISIFETQSGGTVQLLDVPDIEEWPEHQFLSYEKEALGFYITRHPLEGYREEIERVANADSESLTSMEDRDEVRLCGIVSSLKEIKTKKGDRMAFVTLEDRKGYIEVIVFSDLYRVSNEYLLSDTPLFVSGTIDKEEEGAKVIAREILPLSEALKAKGPSRINLVIDADRTDREKLRRLREIFMMHPGECEVFLELNFPHRRTVIALPGHLRVEPTREFMEGLKGLLGYDPFQPQGRDGELS